MANVKRDKYRLQVKETKMIELAQEEGYKNLAVIDGLVCAVQPFAFTWGIVIGIDEYGYLRRYCYEHQEDALRALAKYLDPRGTHPSGPWIKCKGFYQGATVDMLNPELFTLNSQTGLMVRKGPQDEQARQQVV